VEIYELILGCIIIRSIEDNITFVLKHHPLNQNASASFRFLSSPSLAIILQFDTAESIALTEGREINEGETMSMHLPEGYEGEQSHKILSQCKNNN
jgi:hypothetical protein